MSKMKSKTKKWIGAIALVLVAVALSALLGNLTGGFQNGVTLYEVNDDNLYQSVAFADKDGVFADGAKGVFAELDEDNVIHVKGTAEDALTITIGTYTLKAGTSYVFDSSYEGSQGSAYMALVSGDTEYPCYKSATVIPGNSIGSDMQVTLVLKIAKGCELNEKLKPVLCEGTAVADLVTFYK